MNKKYSPSELYELYKKWVISNPNVVTDVETVATWSSYFVAGKINKSPIVSEFVYAVSKLLALFNDRLIREAYGNEVQYYGLREQIKIWLTVIHYCEVLVELVVKHKYSSRAKWTVATLLQLFKCSSALILLYKYKEMPISHPPIPMLQRKKFTEGKETDENSNAFFTLRRSGRVVRRVEGAPPVSFRDWQPIKIKEDHPNPNINLKDLMYAETLHLLKPLIHLAAMRVFGSKAWKQWFIALGLDLASMKLYNRHVNNLPYEQRIEISRRKLGMILYLLRSPMYNGYSQRVIEGSLTSLSKSIPLASFIVSPIIQYLNHWQEIYFYMWAS
ncbi:peroxisomal membrane protein PEX16 [Ostrinia nubilalis]|uniref:peroxisomal membrane protein PEX16 n=1 Tax=Ostrinia furnacalis TaxID=93504 RepID=UPI00103ABFD6|nr:peroxisomal membrane protein PEX16 [Ostrinia furnacalis]